MAAQRLDGLLDALGAQRAKALIDLKRLTQAGIALSEIACRHVITADALGGACFLWQGADAGRDGQGLGVPGAGLCLRADGVRQ